MTSNPPTHTPSQQSESPPTESAQSDALRAGLTRLTGPWWLFLLTGIAWLIISMAVLRFNTTSAFTIGVLMGFVFLAATANEFLIASVYSPWRWARVLMGILFLAGAIWAFVSPLDAFWTLAAALGVLFVLQGTLVLITSIESRLVNAVWGLGVVTGVLEILLGFWTSQQVLSTRAALLIFYVGFLALFRGIQEIVLAFELKGFQKSSAATDVPTQRDRSQASA
jgi:uncharacterized membrane protein HdeD (DUF308 family)